MDADGTTLGCIPIDIGSMDRTGKGNSEITTLPSTNPKIHKGIRSGPSVSPV